MKKQLLDNIALALDNLNEISKLTSLISETSQWIGIYKIGLEQFVRFGPPVLDIVRKADRKIFLDLKLHDIPNTVAKAVESACDLEIDFLTLHTQGGLEMLKAAALAKSKHTKTRLPKLIGVTVLTSIDTAALNNELRVPGSVEAQVTHLARMAMTSGIDGIVCSAADLSFVTPVLPPHFDIVTPGIRPSGSDVNDQKRIATPSEALSAGSTVLVLGRAITAAQHPGKAAEAVFRELAVSRNG